jgi:glycerate kinase
MNDTTPEFDAVVAARHRAMSAEQRMRAAGGMYAAALALVEASLPESLTATERRRARARRMYGNELPAAALDAHARWPQP